MSDTRLDGESYSGWIRLAGSVGIAFVLPIWLILAAGFLQAKPFEAVLAADQNGTVVTVQTPFLARVISAFVESTVWVAILLAIVAGLALVWAVWDRRQRGQTLQVRQVYANQSPAEFALSAEDWHVEVRDHTRRAGLEAESMVHQSERVPDDA